MFATDAPELTDRGLEYLAGFSELRRLTLIGTKVRGPGFAHLEASSKLEWLDYLQGPLDDSAIPPIVKNFKKLRRFDFTETKVTPKGLLLLSDLHWLTSIGLPNDIAGPRSDPATREKFKKLLTTYVKAYKASKAKARAAGEDVPPNYVGPFGLVE